MVDSDDDHHEEPQVTRLPMTWKSLVAANSDGGSHHLRQQDQNGAAAISTTTNDDCNGAHRGEQEAAHIKGIIMKINNGESNKEAKLRDSEDGDESRKPAQIEEAIEHCTGGTGSSSSQAIERTTTTTPNDITPIAWRIGVPVWFLLAFGLLLASDLGSGVAAYYTIRAEGRGVVSTELLLEESILSSVKELWHTQSYVLAILIVISSLSWPFVNIGLSLMFFYTMPMNAGRKLTTRQLRRKERLLGLLDILGKWSFVDIFVFVEIIVAFRAEIPLGFGVILDIAVVPRWGFYGFVAASFMSLIGTYAVLYRQRLIMYPQEQQQDYTSNCLSIQANVSRLCLGAVLIAGASLHVVGSILFLFEIENRQGDNIAETLDFSIVSIGLDTVEVNSESTVESAAGLTFIQILWFLLLLAMPLCNHLLLGILFLVPMSRTWHGRLYAWTEITFTWSRLEVVVISSVVAVTQIPTFGDGLNDSGCPSCYTVDSRLFPGPFAVIFLAAFVHVAANLYLHYKAHGVIYTVVAGREEIAGSS